MPPRDGRDGLEHPIFRTRPPPGHRPGCPKSHFIALLWATVCAPTRLPSACAEPPMVRPIDLRWAILGPSRRHTRPARTPPSRAGEAGVTAYFAPEIRRQLRLLAVEPMHRSRHRHFSWPGARNTPRRMTVHAPRGAPTSASPRGSISCTSRGGRSTPRRSRRRRWSACTRCTTRTRSVQMIASPLRCYD